ncbi:MAG: hypothetical protein H6942_13725 [Candidatus Accumulibacter sp.]|uniref:BPSS1780 family membrane protein n=1 Tax=Accumulibacter sp. TaxID=2053492 RepID=UPI0025DC6CA0|nr:BPSS1780 family membrane protein [Accumulibacter sp.]MCP5249570.1 hypothetical protein [Accumulibacter sp.]
MNVEQKTVEVPVARVDDHRQTVTGNFVPEGRCLPVSHGYQWLLRGWQTFRMAPATWMGIAVAFMVFTLVISAIPFVNLAVNLLIPVFIGGISIGCKAIEDGQDLRFTHLLAGFSSNPGGLLLIGLLYLLAMLLIAAVVGVVSALGAMVAGSRYDAASFPLLALGFMTTLLLFVPLAMAIWLAPPLVVFHRLSAAQAVKTSFFASWHNFAPFCLYGLLVVLAAVIASLPLLLGWLVVLPVLYASLYAFYRDVFFEQ